MDRKKCIREYKDTRRPMGLFRVRNVATGKSFVAASNDLPSMLNRQRFQLEMGVHPVRELQAEWTLLGADAFEIEVLDTLEPPEEPDYDSAEDLKMLLEMWCERLSAASEEFYDKRTTRG